MEYVLDTRTYTDGPLLYDGLQEYQGPSLLARNNRVFRDEDFASLSSIGDSRKRHDLAATGKFGQGFNSCYHWTDGPWIYSRELLLLLDPHKCWSAATEHPGGPTWDVVACKGSVEIQNHLKTFGAFSLDVSKPLEGTIIRLPLRTKEQAGKSKIVQKDVSVLDITNALHVLGREVREGGLIFLKNVRKMTVRIDDKIMWEIHLEERQSEGESVRDQLTADFKALYMPTSAPSGLAPVSKSFVLDMRYNDETTTITRPYLVHHLMRPSSNYGELDTWARSKKLFPWVAVGTPLKDANTSEPFSGRLFSILRLPIETTQPVHIHGLFSITPDRGRLSSSGQTPGYEDMEVKWNHFMFEHCVAEAWAALLLCRKASSWREEGFDSWPKIHDSPTEPWLKLDEFVLRQVINENLQVWNTTHRCVTASEGQFTMKGGKTDIGYAQAFHCIGLPVIYPPSNLLEKTELLASRLSKPLVRVAPHTVRRFLRSQSNTAVPESVSTMVLQYSLLDAVDQECSGDAKSAIYAELAGLSLWPTVSGGRVSLTEGNLMLPRNIEELKLFELSRSDSTIDIRMLTNVIEPCIRRGK